MADERISFWKRLGMLVVLFVGGGIIFVMPYLRGTYYVPMQRALHLNNTQLGLLMTAYGIAAMICYFPGGWIADRFSARKLLTISFILTGLGGLYFATYPPYPMCILLHIYWGITTVLTYWAALIKATRLLGSSEEQGRFFGMLEGGRNLTGVVVSLIALAAFAKLGSGVLGLRAVLLIYGWLTIAIGVLTWFVFRDTPVEEKPGNLLKDIINVIKLPKVWMIALIVLCAYSSSSGQGYVNPYATNIFKASTVFGAMLFIIMQWAGPFASTAAGFLADKISVSKSIMYGFVILMVSQLVLIFLPKSAGVLTAMLINAIVMGFAIYALRGLYYGLLEEADIPLVLTGAATGWISTIGYTPDIWLNIIGGRLLDSYPGAAGYHYFFAVLFALAALGFVVTFCFRKMTVEKRAQIFLEREKKKVVP